MPLLMCPNCQASMQEVKREGVGIDICTQCRGVWLDRGELEKLLGSVKQVETEWQRDAEDYYRSDKHKQHDKHHGYRDSHHRKKSPFERLGDLFD